MAIPVGDGSFGGEAKCDAPTPDSVTQLDVLAYQERFVKATQRVEQLSVNPEITG